MKTVIETFYTALSEKDAETMISCYHEDVVFTDPIFGTLSSANARKMWRMLCTNAKDLDIHYTQVQAQDNRGAAHWEAQYTFSKTKRAVHNRIDAKFEFRDGKIIRHIDHFDIYSWASQALGWKGVVFGKTSFFQKKLQKQTLQTLDKFNPNISS